VARENLTHMSSSGQIQDNVDGVDMLMKDVINAVKYGCPTFRGGYLFKIVPGITPKTAHRVASLLGLEWPYITAKIRDSSNSISLTNINFKEGKPFSDDREGPAIIFPEFSAVLPEGIEVEIRISATVCIYPNHSKVWIRISSRDNERCGTFSEDQINTFFLDSIETSRKLGAIVTVFYKNVLEKCGISTSLKPIYNISLKTAATDFLSAVDLIASEDFKMSQLFEDETSLDHISGIFRMAFGKNIGDFEELAKLSEDGQWMTFDYNGHTEMVGLCSKQHHKKSTEFICLVHRPLDELAFSCFVTKESSKLLVRQIAKDL
jgi:hypothetical protein